jgi:hypothetical protein
MANLLHQGATVQCIHGGQAQPTVTDQHTKVGNQAAVTQSPPYTVSGCPNPVQAGGPCVTATFASAATRVRASGQPVLLSDSQAVCSPTGASLIIISTQTRSTGT